MARIYAIALFFPLFFTTTLEAQTGNIEFIENKGQWDNRVKYMGSVPAGSFFIRAGGFTVLQHNEKDLDAMHEFFHPHAATSANAKKGFTLRSHSYNVDFIGASPDFDIVPDKVISTYNNYFLGNDPSKWASNCRIFQAVTFKNVYPNVDVRYYTEEGRMKYDIVAKPGADISKIAMRYAGADKLEVKNKELVISTSVGNVKELDPYTYQFENGQRKQVNAKYVVRGNEVRFDVKNYNPNETVVIDPSLIFCSFSGSTGSNWGFTATYGPDGSMYGGGIVLPPGGFPVSPGAFQTTYGGGGSGNAPSDMGIIKLSPNGSNRIYATYIGGSQNDQPHSLVVDGAGNLIVCGRTNSANYPSTGSGLIGPGGSYDIAVTKLNAAGSALIGSKRIGGTFDDGVNINSTHSGVLSLQQNYGDDGRTEVILDGSGNIYVASCTQSGNFPATGGSFQTSNGGQQDGVVLKLDPNVNGLSFASYLGGSADDAAYVLSLAPNGNIYVGGGTASSDFPGNHAGTIGTSYQGGVADGFLAVINNSGTSIIRSTFLGTSATDQVFGVQFDRLGFPYVMGQTRGTWPIINAVFNNGSSPQFVAKLQPDLSAYIYSTTFGRPASTPNISPVAFLVDQCENVYISGWGGDIPPNNSYQSSFPVNMPVTPDAIRGSSDPSGGDFYFIVIKKNATQLLYGSYFGQIGGNYPDHVDGGTSRFDQQGVIYQAICGNCAGGATFPTTPGSWSPANQALPTNGCNLAMVKIAFNFAGVAAGIESSINGVPKDSSGCVPLTVDFTDTVQNAVTWYWNFGDLSPVLITTVPNATHTYTAVGTYQVMLIAEDSSTCNIRDTSYMTIRVTDLQATIDFNPVKLLPCDSLRYRFDNLSVAPPARPFTNQSFKWDFGDGSPTIVTGPGSVFHTYTSAGSYVVKLILQDTAYCNAPDTVEKTINIAPLVVAQFTTPPAGCVPYSAVFTNTSVAGQTFLWNFGDGTTSNAINPVHIYNTAGAYTVTLIVIDSATCNISDTTSFTINVFNNPVSNFSFVPDPPLENTATTFTNLSSPDAVNFKWLFGDGDSLLTASRAPVQHQYNATGTFTACLIAMNAAGCPDTFCLPVRALVVPAIDVPNAFTPNSGDVNSVVFARGFGIAKLRFIIWNRWGQKVFETNDRNIGWNGRYKGVIQPMDVYAYTLDVEFFDGTKATKKGDITLIR